MPGPREQPKEGIPGIAPKDRARIAAAYSSVTRSRLDSNPPWLFSTG